jgi:hypothetical protein
MPAAKDLRVLSLRALGRATLARQLLLERHEFPVLKALERLVGLQAQLPRPPFIGLWSRLAEFRREELASALLARKIVRASLLRGTLHLFSASDYLTFRELLGPMLYAGALAVLKDRAKGLDPRRLADEACALLSDEPKTFGEIRDFLLRQFPKADQRAMGHLVRMTLPLVQVPNSEAWAFPSIPDFALAEVWLKKPIRPNPKASGELVRRYLAAFGPASVTDFQTWSGLKAQKDAFAALASELVVFHDERGKELFDLPKAPRPDEGTEAPARLLPEFDNLVLSHADRRRFVADAHRKQVYLPGLRVAPTLLIDGVIAGTWKATRKGKTASLELTPFSALDKKTRATLSSEAEALIRFIEPDASAFELRFGKTSG